MRRHWSTRCARTTRSRRGVRVEAKKTPRTNAALSRTTAGSAFDGQGHAHAPADAQRGDALLRVLALHLVQQGHQDAAARGADRVADGDGAAIHVDLVDVPTHLAVDGTGL